MNLSYRLKKLREEKGITTREISKIFNVSKSTISNYENDIRKPDYEMIKRLAEFYDVSTDYIIGNTDDRNIEVMKDNDIPEILRNVGYEEINIIKEAKKKLTTEEIKELLEVAARLKNKKD
ncbi:MAG: helix-turn-helix domain-containing protein [Candidatus Odinarchaeota archaeon]